jgi:hypothetical protein
MRGLILIQRDDPLCSVSSKQNSPSTWCQQFSSASSLTPPPNTNTFGSRRKTGGILSPELKKEWIRLHSMSKEIFPSILSTPNKPEKPYLQQ